MLREFADKKGWVIVDGYVRADQAVSGTSLEGRTGISELVAAAKEQPPPFDMILIDDTSRFSRNLPQGLGMLKALKFCEVGLYSVSQGLDSRDKSAYQLFTLNLMMDEQFIPGLADKVHRGQVGRVLNGYVPGGRCYG